jgi:ribosomal protein S18 acetylase RimI-like enzyme
MNGDDQQVEQTPPHELASIRPASPEDAEGVALIFLESAEHHSNLDSCLYFVPTLKQIAERYRLRHQHGPGTDDESITLVAELNNEIVGFVDARLLRSSDAMHQALLFCQISEIAVSRRFQSRGIGAQLLLAAEKWGQEQGADMALLEYHSANSRAGDFYRRRMGYRVTSITVVKDL